VSTRHHSGEASGSWILVVAWLLLLAAVAAVLWRDYDAFELGAYSDDARYFRLASALAFEDDYSLATGPGPRQERIYPFVFPLALSAVVRLRPHDLQAANAIATVATMASLSMLFWGWPLLAPGASRRSGLAVAALTGLSPLVLSYARMVMSEALFTALVLAAFLWTEGCLRTGQPRSAGRLLLLGALLACVVFCRPVGITLTLAIALRCAWERLSLADWGALAAGALAVVGSALLWTPYALHDVLPGTAMRHLQRAPQQDASAGDSITARIGLAARAYGGQELRLALLPLGGGEHEERVARRLALPWLPAAVPWMISAATLLGFVVRRRGASVSATVLLFEALYIAVLLLWPFREARLLVPIWPFLAYQFVTGIGFAASLPARLLRGRHSQRRFFTGARTVAAASLLLASFVAALRPANDSRLHVRDFAGEGRWFRAHSRDSAVILCRESIPLYLHTGRSTVEASDFHSAAELARAVDLYRIDYIVVGPAKEWREDGGRSYDQLTADVLLPFAEELVREHKAEVVRAADPHELVSVYHILRQHPG